MVHLIWLHENTPARQALVEMERQTKKVKEGQKPRELNMIKEDLKKIDNSKCFDESKDVANEKKSILKVIHNRMSECQSMRSE